MPNPTPPDWRNRPPWVSPPFPRPERGPDAATRWLRIALAGRMRAVGKTFRQEILSVQAKMPKDLSSLLLQLAGNDRRMREPDSRDPAFLTPAQYHNWSQRAAKGLLSLEDWGAKDEAEAEALAREYPIIAKRGRRFGTAALSLLAATGGFFYVAHNGNAAILTTVLAVGAGLGWAAEESRAQNIAQRLRPFDERV